MPPVHPTRVRLLHAPPYLRFLLPLPTPPSCPYSPLPPQKPSAPPHHGHQLGGSGGPAGKLAGGGIKLLRAVKSKANGSGRTYTSRWAGGKYQSKLTKPSLSSGAQAGLGWWIGACVRVCARVCACARVRVCVSRRSGSACVSRPCGTGPRGEP